MEFTGRTAFVKNNSDSGVVIGSQMVNEQQILDIEVNGQVQQFSHESVVILGDMHFSSK